MSQASYNVPTGGSFSMVTFAGLMNGAYNALASQNSGASAPANGPGNAAQEFQTWFNTTNINFPTFNFFDGVNWDKIGTMDVANSNWLPKMGGGAATLASAATVNIGNSPQTYISISGTTTITSFGTAATVGEERKLTFLGQLQITNNPALINCPSGANVITQAGDNCTAVYQGSNIWNIFGYVRATAATGLSLPTGATFWQPSAGVSVTGAVRCNARTIGSASSGATELASAAAVNLYTFLWNNISSPSSNARCPVGGGLGASAAADFAANKPLGLPDMRGMVPAGLDDMGNSAASRLTSATMSPNGTTPLASGGGQTHTMLTSDLPVLSFSGTSQTWSTNQSGIGLNADVTRQITSGTGPAYGGNNAGSLTLGAATTTVTPAGSVNAGSANNPVTMLQPTVTGTWYICL